MRILHTSDWHLGHVLYNYDRREEQGAMLEQMAAIVKQEQPDVFLLAGDVYDSTQPSSSVQKMFANAMVRIHEACPSMRIICISGNHDSGSKHVIFKTPWELLNVSMLGMLPREEEGDQDLIVNIEGKGYVVAVPYTPDRLLPEGLFVRLQEQVASMNEQEQLPVVLMAHLAVSGSDYRGHDNASETVVGGMECQSLETFGEGYDYVALGHIHRAQTLRGSKGRVRYSGTPLAVNFDEAMDEEEHGVTLVEISAHGDLPSIKVIPIHNPRPLVTLPVDGFGEWPEVRQLFGSFPDDIPAYIRLNVLVDGRLPVGANDEAQQIAALKQCRYCLINAKRKDQVVPSSGFQAMTTTEFQQMTPMEVAQRYLESQGDVFDEGLATLFNEVMKGIDDED